MKFVIEEKVFEALPTACFGVVVARGIDNRSADSRPQELLQQSIAAIEEKFAATKAKEAVEIAPYRDAFQKLGINPNKFMSSIEAMASRIEKKKGFPSIKPVVDLGMRCRSNIAANGPHDIDAAAAISWCGFP